MASFHTIVAAVDFSDITGEVVETARDLARLNHARLHVIHAVGDPFRSMYTVETGAFDFTDMIRQWTEAAQKQLASLVEKYPMEQGLLTTAVLEGAPADAIVEYADEQQADLVVVGLHGRGAVSRLLLGSVAERVLHLARRSVLVVYHRARHLTPFEVKAAAGVGA